MSGGYFSRLERGWATAPLYVYIANVFGVEPGRLLGPDDAQSEVTEGEMTLVRLMRRVGIDPDEAIARVAGLADGSPAPTTSPGEAHP